MNQVIAGIRIPHQSRAAGRASACVPIGQLGSTKTGLDLTTFSEVGQSVVQVRVAASDHGAVFCGSR